MYNKLYEFIEFYFNQGTPPHRISAELVKAGWPEAMVNEALNAWLEAHGHKDKNTPFEEWLAKYHRRARMSIAIVVVLNLLVVAVALLKPWPTKILADSAFGSIPAPGPLEPYTGTSTLILITSLMTLGLFIVGSIFGFIRDFIILRIGYRLNRSIKEESFKHILHLPLFHQERLSKGDYVYRQNVVTDNLSDLVLKSTSSMIESVIIIVGVLAIMLTFNVGLTIMSVVLMPLLYLTMRLIGPRMGKYAKMLTKVKSETSTRITESVDNAETVQAFTLEDKQLNQVEQLWDFGFELNKKGMLWRELLVKTNGLLIVTATAAVMYVGGSAALRGEMTLGELLIFMVYMGYLLGPVENLVQQFTTRNQKKIQVRRIYEVLTDHEGIEDLRKEHHLPPNTQGQLEFNGVSYSYKDKPVFENLNLLIPPGQKVAIIGPSGGGKSTILKLAPLFIEPTAGKIFIDGIDASTVSLQDLRKRISWVSQAPQLFDGTIIDNLLDADVDREIDKQEIAKAVMTANVDEFALKLPLGLASPAGENGGSLSGGQRQRVAIARALLKQAPIVCLDEPTAALDAKSENYIRDSLMKMIEGKTVLMVTHRKSLLSLMDVVYVLEDSVLTNVDELGGLDSYLAKLEGLEEHKATMEIAEEKLVGVNPEFLVDQYEELVSQPAFNTIKTADHYKSEKDFEQSVILDKDDTTLDISHSDKDNDDEVVLKLH